METITVVNIKCGGCKHKISSALEKAGLSEISIDAANQTVSFVGDTTKARDVLSNLGYPEADSAGAESIFKMDIRIFPV